MASDGAISVVCRFRPQNKLEESQNGKPCVSFDDDGQSVSVGGDGEYGAHKCTFDRIFPEDTTQADVFEFAAKPVIDEVTPPPPQSSDTCTALSAFQYSPRRHNIASPYLS